MNTKIKVLLINAINTGVEVESRYPHLGFGYLISYAQKVLPEAEIDFRVFQGEEPREIQDFVPDIVGISSVSQNFSIAKGFSDYFAGKNIPVVIGGIHITVLPESLPESAFAGCLGEGEKTFSEILSLLMQGTLKEKIKEVAGLVYWENGGLRYSARREIIANLDEIPFPERSHMVIGNHAHMFTSRGCPYRCVFCASSRFWKELRFFSANYVADEIEFLYQKYNVKLISFFDDLFVADLSRMKKLIEILAAKGLLGKIKFTTNCRANLVCHELTGLLKKLNIVSVGLGLESGNEETLRFLKTGNVTVEQNRMAIDLLKNAGIYANASFVIGSPHETERQIMETYEFIKNSRLDLFDVYFLTPYPGTPIWDYAKQKGLVSNEMKDWKRLDVNAYRDFSRVIFVSEKIPSHKLIAIYKKFRKMRLFRNILKTWNHPLLHMAPRVIFMMIYDFFRRIFRNCS